MDTSSEFGRGIWSSLLAESVRSEPATAEFADAEVIDLTDDALSREEPDPDLVLLQQRSERQNPGVFGDFLLPLYLEQIRQVFSLKPKSVRGRGRPKGTELPSTTRMWALWLKGYAAKGICLKLGIPVEERDHVEARIKSKKLRLSDQDRKDAIRQHYENQPPRSRK